MIFMISIKMDTKSVIFVYTQHISGFTQLIIDIWWEICKHSFIYPNEAEIEYM